MPIVTMLSDFGLRDSYVSQMKGVVLGICPDAKIIDISHLVQRHDVVSGAFLLETAVPFFPKNSVHLAVVDPGVGTARLPVVVKAKNATLVGPDNGLLERAAQRLGVTGVYEINFSRLQLGRVSDTFHGRDVFAKAAGELASGLRVEEVGPAIKGLVKLKLRQATVNGTRLECRILHIDNFGNLITNAHNVMLRKLFSQAHRQVVVVRSSSQARQVQIARTYSEVNPGKMVATEGSQGYVEVAAREANASKKLQVRTGDRLEISIAT